MLHCPSSALFFAGASSHYWLSVYLFTPRTIPALCGGVSVIVHYVRTVLLIPKTINCMCSRPQYSIALCGSYSSLTCSINSNTEDFSYTGCMLFSTEYVHGTNQKLVSRTHPVATMPKEPITIITTEFILCPPFVLFCPPSVVNTLMGKSGRPDSNRQSLVPKTSALPLGYVP